MDKQKMILLRRDCDAYLIPAGTKIGLPKGTEVSITQSLGGSYTVNVYGNLARIDGKDGDALGEAVVDLAESIDQNLAMEEKVYEMLKTCFDPEIPVNIVDLGLIYEVKVDELAPDSYYIEVTMTLTAPGCGMGPIIAADAEQKIRLLPGITDVLMRLVFDPPWDRSMMSEAAKLQLGLL